MDDLEDFNEESEGLYQIDSEFMISILSALGVYNKWDWDVSKFISCINAIKSKRPSLKYYLLVKVIVKFLKELEQCYHQMIERSVIINLMILFLPFTK